MPKEKTPPEKPQYATPQARPDNKVPEWAENSDHYLRRLVRIKEAERAKKPGLYR